MSREVNKEDFDQIIEAGKPMRGYLRDIWCYRELFYFLAWRDILVRYKQTVIGITWCIIRPLITMVIFTIIFGKLAKFPSEGMPYPVLVFVAMLPWQFFADTISEGSNSLIENINLLTKTFFPRIVVPGSKIIVNLVDFFISFCLLFFLLLGFKLSLGWRFTALPLFLFLTLLIVIGFSFWLAALNVKYRDFRYVVPFILQVGFFVSPVAFLSTVVPEKWRLIYYLNPMAGIIDGFRWSIFSNMQIYWPGFFVSLVSAIIIFFYGVWYFYRNERIFADII